MAIVRSLMSWEIMVVAMMFPSVIPVAEAFDRVSRSQSDRSVAQAAFFSAYAVIWSLFALGLESVRFLCVSFAGILPLPAEEHFLLSAVVLIAAGFFQFTEKKRSCLRGCRSAATVIAQYYFPGWRGAWNLGLQHGWYCLGCCFMLMGVMLVLGMHNIALMIALTAVMSLERLWQHGEILAAITGIVLLLLGFLLLFKDLFLSFWA
ncbi:DUF2182 domain-containing protein [Leptolyngbya sp. AN03gr2]|uniref:DUF2182 domain-containing protein n=1 Tax=unclassified Leptolyngbya TaxID=2650499 RepID=UPI003D31EF4C